MSPRKTLDVYLRGDWIGELSGNGLSCPSSSRSAPRTY
jgi:hypothetical protein